MLSQAYAWAFGSACAAPHFSKARSYINKIIGDIITMSKLIKYGIYNEQSNYRIHVCPLAGIIYIFPTVDGIEAIKNKGKYRHAKDSYNNLSGGGYIVKPDDINNIKKIKIPKKLLKLFSFEKADGEMELGNKAQQLVVRMMRSGALVGKVYKIEENVKCETGDIDIIADGVMYEVKCDYIGGENINGNTTGNLFIQTKERRYIPF